MSVGAAAPIRITFFITSYKGLFLNMIVCRINGHKVHMSYTLRIKKFMYDNSRREKHTVAITHVGRLGKFDEGALPELDAFVAQLGT